jgi:O-antigen/teichoic acid export membrane protein
MKLDSVIQFFKEHVCQWYTSVLVRAGIWLTLVNVISGLLGYVYQIAMARMLDPVDFALFSALMALTVFFVSPLSGMLLVISRRVSGLSANGQVEALRKLYTRSHQLLLVLGAALFVLLLLFDDLLALRLRVPDITPIWIFAAAVVSTAFVFVNNAYFQGLQNFGRLGWLGFLALIVKILASVIFIKLGFGVIGALAGVFLAATFIWLVGSIFLLNMFPKRLPQKDSLIGPFFFNDYAPVLLASTAFAAITQLDIVVVNWYFSRDAAGLYAAAAVLGKAVLYLPGGIVTALFPQVAENDARNRSSVEILWQATLVTVFLSVVAAIAYWFLADWLIEIFYGPAYSGAGELLRWYGFAILPISLVMVAEYFLIAKGRVLFAWIFLGLAPLQLSAYSVWHQEPWMIVMIMGVFGAIMAVVGWGALWFAYKKEFRIK